MRISACLIMRDAAKDLVECLESLKDGVDEIVVVDTGSVDGSVEIARRYTDKIFFFDWRDDFAAARNYCLEQATGDWIVFLDSDERLSRETRGNLRRVVEGLAAMGYDVGEIRRDNVDEVGVALEESWDYSERIFRNDPLLRYREAVHEHLALSGGGEAKNILLPPEDLRILHKGYAGRRLQGKYRRDLQILEQMRRRGEEKRLMDYYLALLYNQVGEYAKAIGHAKEAIRKKAVPPIDTLSPWRTWCGALQAMGASPEEQEEMLRLAMKECPKAPDFYAFYGGLFMAREDFASAWEYLVKAEQLLGEFQKNYPLEQNSLYRIRGTLYRAMGDVCLKLGKRDLAQHYAELEWQADAPGEARGYSGSIPPRSRLVVEFACGDGETGRAFRRIQPECRYIGADPDKSLLCVAEKSIPETIAATPASLDFAAEGIGPVDCILYQDRAIHGLTLECLRRHGKQLSEEGQMVFVLENVGYFRYVTGCFAGREKPFGRSMVTLQELGRLIGNAGLHVLQVDAVRLAEDEAEAARPESRALLAAFDAWRKAAGMKEGRDAWVCRYIVRAARKPLGSKLLLHSLLGEPLLSARARVREPLGFLGTDPGIQCREGSKGKGVHLASRKEFPRQVLLRQRQHFPDRKAARQQISVMRKAGCLIVYETDVLPVGWEEARNRCQNLDILGAHVVQVPTEALAEAFRPYHPHVAVFRNELAELPPMREFGEDGPVTVFCGVTQEEDWQEILPVLDEMAGEDIHLRILDRVFFEALATEHKVQVGNDAWQDGRMVPYRIYKEELRRADIVLLPRKDTERNRMKSDLLFIEAAGHGAAVLAAPIPYARTVQDGVTGFLYRSLEEFREKLACLAGDRELRRNMAQAAYGYVRRERLLCQHYEERLDFYRRMLDRWQELDGELEARLGKLMR
ncbi:MAG: glycosyltransferase [Selenomonadaceae bacterium]|nr:glycosyltransferase [Selenomonadaceae bacterium]